MNKRQYFIEALQSGAYKYRSWILSTFCAFKSDSLTRIKDQHPYKLAMDPEDKTGLYFFDPNNEMNHTKIDDAVLGKPIFTCNEKLVLNTGDLENVLEPVVTTYGNALINSILLIYPFGNKIPFITGRIDGGKLEKQISAITRDLPKEGEERDPKLIYTDDLRKYLEAAGSIAGLSVINTPSITAKALTIAPEVLKLRDQLLKQYDGQLDDPAILAKIESEVAAADKESFKGDPAAKFYIKDKSFSVVRKKAFVMVGRETVLGDTNYSPIKTSLLDGIDTRNLPAVVDGIRAGSFYRGHQTALGGESVKYFYRIFQNTRIIEADCGSKAGLPWLVTEYNYKTFIGRYLVGSDKPLTEEVVKAAIGKQLEVRSPMLCKTEAPSFCAHCVGEMLAQRPNAIHILIAEIGSTFMMKFMKKMHGTAMKTARFRPELSFT